MNIDRLFQASKTIEEEGIDGIHTTIELVGKQTALSLLITHLRRGFGSMNSYPAGPEIDEKVKAVLIKNNLL